MSEMKQEQQQPEIQWHEVTAETFDIYGVFPDKDGLLSVRIPRSVAETVSKGVAAKSAFAAGGRIRFSTDSTSVSLKVEYGKGESATVMNYCVTHGFDVYRCEQNGEEAFVGAMRPKNPDVNYQTVEYCVQTRCEEMSFYTINMPCFAEVKRAFIGIENGSRLERGKKYRNEKPVVFYGSSITQGVAAGRPGNTYENFISQTYNLDYRNYGFGGNAKAEPTLAEFLAGLEMCAFVSDYDHNAPNVEYLRQTHYSLYETIRRKHPDIPYIMISKPDFFTNPEVNAARRDVIRESYEKAKAAGDENVWLIDGETLFAGPFYRSCTSDGVHPNDLGFYRMAEKIGPVIMQALGLT